MNERGITLVEVMVALVILTGGLTALAHLTAAAARATTAARVLEAGNASLGRVVDSLQREGAPGRGQRTFPDALGPSAAPPLTVDWSVPGEPGGTASAWLVHPTVPGPVEIPFVTRAPW